MNKKIFLLSSAPVSKALLAMGLPTMIGMMINAVYNIVDAYFVGNLGTNQMGAISVVFPISQVIVGLGLLFGSGAGSYISRLLGKGEKDKADKTASTAIYSSILLGIIVIACTLLFLKPILILTGATPKLMYFALNYAKIYIAFSIFNIFNVTMNNIVTSEGSSRTTMLALMSGAILNIGLDPLFINVFKMGVSGAAIATAISQVISTVVYLIYILRRKTVFSFRIKQITYSKEIMTQIFKIGVPTMIFQILTSLSITLINNQAKPYGESVIAGMGAVTRIISIGSLMIFGFIKGFQPIAGFSYGAKNYERLDKSIKISVLWSTIFCILFGAILIAIPSQIISLFSKNDAEMISVGMKSLRANGLSFMVFGFGTVYSSLFLALGKGLKGFITGACRQGICFVPVILLLPKICGLNGVLYAQPIADVITVIVIAFMAIALTKQLKLQKREINA